MAYGYPQDKLTPEEIEKILQSKPSPPPMRRVDVCIKGTNQIVTIYRF